MAADGGAVYDLAAIVNVNRAQNLKGPIVLRSGVLIINASAYKNGAGSAILSRNGRPAASAVAGPSTT